MQLTCHWDQHRQAFQIGSNLWFHPTKEDVYFITKLSRGAGDFPQIRDVPLGVSTKIHRAYSHKYINDKVTNPSPFQVPEKQLCIVAFGAEEVRCLSILLTTALHSTTNGKNISFYLLHDVDSLMHRPRCIRWSAIFLQQFFFL